MDDINKYEKYLLCIYPRKNPIEPIYVGKGKNKRLLFHKNRTKNPILKRKIKKIKENGLEPVIEKIQENLIESEALKLEIELIAKYGRIDNNTGILCNLTDGGETTTGWIPSKETKELWSLQRKGKKQTEAQYQANCNRKHTEETKNKLSIINKGQKRHSKKGQKRHSKEQIEKIRILHIGSKRSTETRLKMSLQRKGKEQTKARIEACLRNCKPIICVNNKKIYQSAKDTAKDLNITCPGISMVARGTSKSHFGYKFKYLIKLL